MKIQDIREAMDSIAAEFKELSDDIRAQLLLKSELSVEDRTEFIDAVTRARAIGVIKDDSAARLSYVIDHWGRLDLADRMRFYVKLSGLVQRDRLSKEGLPLERQVQITRGVGDVIAATRAYTDRSIRRVLHAAGERMQEIAVPRTESKHEPDPLPMDEVTQQLRASSRLVATAWQEFLKAREDLVAERRSRHPDAR